MKTTPFKSIRLLAVAALTALATLTTAAPASAIPDPASIVAARIDAQIKPKFGALLRPPLHRWRPLRPRYRYGRWWNPVYREGRWCYDYEFDPAYTGIQDEYGGPGQYPDFDPAYGGYNYGGRFVGPDYPGAIYTGPVLGPSYSYGPATIVPDGPPRVRTPEEIWDGPQSLRVDCAGHDGMSLHEAARQIGEGGTIYIRGSGGSCTRGVEIDHSMSIVGEARGAFDRSPGGPAVIAASNNGPCVRVAPGVRRVEIRDVILEAGAGGRSACVQAWGAELAVVQTTIHYVGEGCAVYSQGGRLLLRDVVIDADTPDVGVLAEGADVDAKHVRIRTRGTGMDLFPRGKDGVHVDEVSLLTGGDGAPRGEIGLIVRGRGTPPGEVDLRHLRIEGFRTGAWLERGGDVSITSAWIGRAQLGVVSDGAHLTLQDSVVSAKEVGVYVMTGKALITHNRILDFTDTPIDADRFAEVTVEENWIYPQGGCGPFGGWRGWCKGRGGFGVHLNLDVGLSFGWEGVGFDFPSGYRQGDERGFDWRRRGGGGGGGHDYRPPRSTAPDRPPPPTPPPAH